MAKDDKTVVEKNRFSTLNQNHSWLYGVGAFVILVIIFGLGLAIGHHREFGNDDSFRPRLVKMAGGAMPMGGRSGFNGTVTVNGQTRTSGVVTAVNASGFTIASNGATTNVTTNSSTQWQGGNQVKQNDSVLVFGSTSNGTLTASEVEINP